MGSAEPRGAGGSQDIVDCQDLVEPEGSAEGLPRWELGLYPSPGLDLVEMAR